MKRMRWLASGLLASLLVTQLGTAQAEETSFSTTMPDANYRACVTTKLGLANDATPTEAQLSSITELSCTKRGITDATGTSAMPNLTKLFLSDNELTNVAPIAGASKVFSLGISNNKLSDISALSTMKALTSVDIFGNQLRDISVLGTLPNHPISGTRHAQQVAGTPAVVGESMPIPTLVGRAGKVFTATAPSSVTVTGNTVTYPAAGSYEWTFRDDDDFNYNGKVIVTVAEPATSLLPDPALKACVNSRLGQEADAEPTSEQLAGISGTLTCNSKGVESLSGVSKLSSITTLTVNDNAITNVTPLTQHPSLITINIKNNNVSDLAGLGTLPKLKTLDLTQNPVTSLTGLGSNDTIYTLRIGQTGTSTKAKLTNLAGISNLKGLGVLNINYQAVRSLAPLQNHPALATLDAEHGTVSDVSALNSITTLNRVRLSDNQISDLSSLKNLTSSNIGALNQTLTTNQVTAEDVVPAPSVIGKSGSTTIATPPVGLTVTDGKVSYPAAGDYQWLFEVKENTWESAYFSGTITQQVMPAPEPIVDVEIPDAGLRGCLADAVGNDGPAEPISKEMLAALEKVSCVGKGITDLSGVEHLSGTKELVLTTNSIADLMPLAPLSGLEKLMLPGNKISDVAPLASLTGLKTLTLSQNPVSSISTLAPLTELTDLEVTQRSSHDHADLKSLDGIQGMTKLTRLVVNNSSLTDISPVTDLTGLTRLYLSSNQIKDLSPLAKLTKLTHLGVNNNEITSVSPLKALTSLESLDLATNKISDLSPLGGMPAQAYMGLKARWQQASLPEVPAQFAVSPPQPRDYDGTIVEVTPPEGVVVVDGKVSYPAPGNYSWTFSARTDLGEHFSGTISQPVGDVVADPANIPDSALRSCVARAAGLASDAVPSELQVAAIETLNCADQGIVDLSGIELLTSAESIDLADNPLTGTKPLRSLTKLKTLDLSRTGLSEISDLTGLQGLTTLQLDGNQLRDLTGLSEEISLSAKDQTGKLEDARGDVLVSFPIVKDRTDAVPVQRPASSEPDPAGAVFPLAGNYEWSFASSDGIFTGKLSQRITSDRVDLSVHAGAAACVAADNVWVVVERDTGLQEGGCATEFADGFEALESAGFSSAGNPFLSKINGYPTASADNFYWSYWSGTAEPAEQTLTYDWNYYDVGPADARPKAGTVEGWRYVEWIDGEDTPTPSWVLTRTVTEPTSVTANIAATARVATSWITTGRISPETSGTTVWLQRQASAGHWLPVAQATTDESGTFRINSTPAVGGQIKYRVSVAANGVHGPVVSAPVTVTVRQPSGLSANIATSARVGLGWVTTGSVSPARSGSTVWLQRRTGDNWLPVAKANTDSDGRFRIVSTPAIAGRVDYRVSLAADGHYLPAVSASVAVSVSQPTQTSLTAPAVVRQQSTFTASGSVAGGVAGTVVWLQRQDSSGNWLPVAQARLDQQGRYTIISTARVSGVINYRASTTANAPALASISAAVRVTVR